MYPVTIKNSEGQIKQIINKKELSLKHWGHDKKCAICKRFYFPKIRRGSQGIVFGGSPNDPDKSPHPKNKKPRGGVCSPECRRLQVARRKRKREPLPIVMVPCGICRILFPISRKGNKYCSEPCKVKRNLQRATAKNKELKAQRMERKKKLNRGEKI